MLDYQTAIAYLFSRLPMYHRIGPAAYKADLKNIQFLDKKLSHPHRNYPCIHVAGTNGKGSVSHLLASVFQEAGYTTGLFTSPHLIDFRERIKVGGKPADTDFIVSFTENIKKSIEEIEPSFFEITTAMAFQYFAEKQVDIAVIETGLGGRLDSTNIIEPELSVITNISLEHTSLLGSTIEKIAMEKAGIIKNNIPAVIGRKSDDYLHVFREKAKETNSPLIFAEDKFSAGFLTHEKTFSVYNIFKTNYLEYEHVLCGLSGSYQAENLSTLMASIDILSEKFKKLNNKSILNGIKNVVSNTALWGRWQIVQEHPYLVLDIAHNPDAVEKMLRELRHFQYKNLYIVLGMSEDKNHQLILEKFPRNAFFYFCKPDVPRGLDSDLLYRFSCEKNLNGINVKTVYNALESALDKANENDFVLVTGSAFVVAEALSYLIEKQIFTQ
ncbi:MAG TPA: folylpolyglutamate synthase/dihydrofolate synthase family protein [Bacteroidia bacterium]|nr:folylpolyglutamate synthase/dihydrofolate synthase family protein [Bacteroidia bacterium]HRS58141.1 folylpolyglutamate synthase/dihydrofolate synthase family protein [Bacteroidia bacterium]HRU67471.1 folylpolyglutamate synthase/dihydrofolate synthase family protein [Bacteroidia bacterium]